MVLIRFYKIVNNISIDVYIGSTKQKLLERYKGHKRDSKRRSNSKLYKFMNEIGINNFSIELIEERNYDNENSIDRFIYENELIKMYSTLNTISAKKTKEQHKIHRKEYIEKNKEYIKEYKRKWSENNKDKIVEYRLTERNKNKH